MIDPIHVKRKSIAALTFDLTHNFDPGFFQGQFLTNPNPNH